MRNVYAVTQPGKATYQSCRNPAEFHGVPRIEQQCGACGRSEIKPQRLRVFGVLSERFGQKKGIALVPAARQWQDPAQHRPMQGGGTQNGLRGQALEVRGAQPCCWQQQ